MKNILKVSFFIILIIFFSACTPKLKIYSLSDNAFVENNRSVKIVSNIGNYPLFDNALKDELSLQIIENGFTIDDKNPTYIISLQTISHDQATRVDYEPVYRYYRYCDYNGHCTYVPKVHFVPCLNAYLATIINIRALNLDKNSDVEFNINNSGFANNCDRFSRDFSYYDFYGYYNYDRFLFDSLSKGNIQTIAKKIRNSLFPIIFIHNEVLYDNIESIKVDDNIQSSFRVGYRYFEDKKYQEAIAIYENIKSLLDHLPYELLFNIATLYEFTGNLDSALKNYELLDNTFINKDLYIKRILIKKRYNNG